MTNLPLHSNPLPAFKQLNVAAIKPALDAILAQNRREIKKLLAKNNYTWANLLAPLNELNNHVSYAWSQVSHLNAVCNSQQLRKVYNQCLPEITKYFTEQGHNKKLFLAVKKIAASRAYEKLHYAQQKVIQNELRDSRLSGVDLPVKQKQQFARLQEKLARLENKFSENVLDATHGWKKHVEDKRLLQGIPEQTLTVAKDLAKQQQLTGWVFTLDSPVYLVIMNHADNAKLRHEIYRAYITRASDQGPNAGKWDNSKIMRDILICRHKIAKLLGFANYADAALVPRMADNPQQVLDFIAHLAQYALPKAKQEYAELQDFARRNYKIKKLQPWDIGYYSEKLRQQKHAVSQEQLRQYFPEPQVLKGMFKIVNKLFGITVKKVSGVSTWHKDVKVFAIYDASGRKLGIFYADLYARVGKRGGAWMDDGRVRNKLKNGKTQLPIAYLTCNFAGPVAKHAALFTHDDVHTLFHEFGHCLQHLLTKIAYSPVAGMRGVPWDAVELASQFLENWVWEQAALDLISKHYVTGKKLSKAMHKRLLAVRNFQVGMQTVRQLEFALFDMRLHLEFDAKKLKQIQQVLNQVRKELSVMPVVRYNRFQHGFAHIFAGGYSAGYYSYKWAEVLAKDAFAAFQEHGVFDRDTGKRFRETFLEQGGAVDPLLLFKKFRGREPNPDAHLKDAGMKE